MYYPNFEKFEDLSHQYQIVPVYREISADLDTPVSAFYKLMPMDYGFLLESVEGGEHLARYSFLGANPEKILILQDGVLTLKEGKTSKILDADDPLDIVRTMLFRTCAPNEGLPYFTGGAVGYLGYDTVRLFERLPEPNPDDMKLPDMVMMFCRTMIVFDHLKHKIKVISNVEVNGREAHEAYKEAVETIEDSIAKFELPLETAGMQLAPAGTQADSALKSNMEPEEFRNIVDKAKEYIFAGDIFQVVLAQRFEVPAGQDAFMVYRRLRTINPSPYMGFLKFDDFSLIASSPELLIKVQDDEVEVRPIAGTRRRGADIAEDRALEADLLADEKELAEHIMLVDLGRNDIGRVCKLGSVEVKELMAIEKYSHVMHIVSSIRGSLDEGQDCFTALKSAFPAGTVSGAPKIRAMEIIDELEPTRRGPYAGIFGYFGYTGNMDTGITIRTIFVKSDKAFIQAGAGIVADSDPDSEYLETVNKARALLTAVYAESNADKQ